MTKLYSIFLQHPVVTTDSRDCPAGSIFFALKGERFDGNKYAAAALEKGCAYAVIDEAQYAVDDRYIVVPDVLAAFQQLAREHRRTLGTRVIGVTGTNGKTTTKELIAAVLGRKYRVLYTQGNFNNDIGVPKTLLRLTAEDEMAVVEMGASHPGDIKTLVDIVEPDYGIITNVGMAHLQGFGSFEGVVRTKGELYDKLRQCSGSRVFIDADNIHLAKIADGLTLVKYSVENQAEDVAVKGEIVDCAPFLHFRWKAEGTEHEVHTHLVGAYNIYNMLAAATIGLYFGVTPEQVDEALEGYIPSNNRSQLTVTKNNSLIVDTYNANPTSMAAALHNFAIMDVKPKMLILGDMGELGEASAGEHRKVAEYLQEEGFENVWLVGSEFGNTPCPYRKFPDVAAVKEEIAQHPVTGHYILIKGSNSMRLFELPELL